MINEIKSKYILQYIFEHVCQRIILNLSKYNKLLQKKMDISLNDYRLFNQIEIEIIPKGIPYYSKEKFPFIKMFNENKNSFYVYFDDNPKRIKRNYFIQKDKISKIKVIIENENQKFDKLFKNCKFIKEINFIKFNQKI